MGSCRPRDPAPGWPLGTATARRCAAIALLTLAAAGAQSDAGKPAKGGASAAGKLGAAAPKSAGKANAPPPPPLTLPAAELRDHARFLATSPKLTALGAAPRAAAARQYMAEQLYETGLLPGGDGQHGIAGFLQAVSMVGARSVVRGVPQFRSNATTIPVQIAVAPREIVLFADDRSDTVEVKDSEIVFAGHCVTAPAQSWDDYKGSDVRGKVVLCLDGGPKGFAGQAAVTRWPQKVAEAARRGAAAALLVHSASDVRLGDPSLPFWRSYYASEQLLPSAQGDSATSFQLRGVITDDAARRLLQAGREDLDTLRRAADERDFEPRALRVRMTARLQNQTRPIESANIVGILPGSDETLREEAVLYTAHIDGVNAYAESPPEGSVITPGVRDRIVGAAALLTMAKATRQTPPPARSQIFALVVGHGEGFVGTARLLKHLPAPVRKVIAHVSVDGINIGDEFPEITQSGRGKSSLDAILDAAATAQGRHVGGEPRLARDLYYRNESLPLARLGIPSLLLAPLDLDSYLGNDYLQPTDVFRDGWTFAGGAQDSALLYACGLAIAGAGPAPTHRDPAPRTWPHFVAGDEFASPAPASVAPPVRP